MSAKELRDAASKGDANRLAILLRTASPDQGQNEEQKKLSPLMTACMWKDTKDCTPEQKLSERQGRMKCVQLLIEAKAKIDRYDMSNHYTALHIGASWGLFEIVKCLIEHKASINVPTKEGQTPLMLAAEYPHASEDMIQYLLEAGADRDLLDKLGRRAFDVARPEFKLLLQPNLESLIRATTVGDVKRVEEILAVIGPDDGWDETSKGYTPLMTACQVKDKTKTEIREKKYNCAKLLLEAKAKVDTRDKVTNYTALMIAASWGLTDFVRSLIEFGANINLQDKQGHTALMLAVMYPHAGIDCVEEFLAAGADCELKQKDGKTALMLAVQPTVAQYIREHLVPVSLPHIPHLPIPSSPIRIPLPPPTIVPSSPIVPVSPPPIVPVSPPPIVPVSPPPIVPVSPPIAPSPREPVGLAISIVPTSSSPPPQPQSSPRPIESYPELQNIPYESIKTEMKLGQGGEGFVYRALWSVTPVALKRLSRVDDTMIHRLLQEAAMIARLAHPHIVRVFGICTKVDKESIIMELCERSLFNLLYSGQELSWDTRITMALQIADAMRLLHSIKTFHRDLKSLNVLVRKDGSVCITDFGLAKMYSLNAMMKSLPVGAGIGTLGWMAPEVSLGKTFLPASDVYSYGVLLYEILTRALPHENLRSGFVSLEKIEEYPSMKDCPSGLLSLLKECLKVDPTGRPPFEEIVKNLSDIKDQLPSPSSQTPPRPIPGPDQALFFITPVTDSKTPRLRSPSSVSSLTNSGMLVQASTPTSGELTTEQWTQLFTHAKAKDAKQLAANFVTQQIQIEDVLRLNETEWKSLGVTVFGVRRAIQRVLTRTLKSSILPPASAPIVSDAIQSSTLLSGELTLEQWIHLFTHAKIKDVKQLAANCVTQQIQIEDILPLHEIEWKSLGFNVLGTWKAFQRFLQDTLKLPLSPIVDLSALPTSGELTTEQWELLFNHAKLKEAKQLANSFDQQQIQIEDVIGLQPTEWESQFGVQVLGVRKALQRLIQKHLQPQA